MNNFEHKLMDDNITRANLDKVIEFLQQDPIPILTNASPKIKEVEDAWSKWLGVKYSLFVSSGTAANQLTMLALKQKFPNGGSILAPTITWVSDSASVLQAGFEPIFIDADIKNLGMDLNHIKKKVRKDTIAIFLTHALGFNGLSDELLDFCGSNNILLIEDCCEGYPVIFKGRKTGTFGFASNFSMFHAHHASAIEAGMICTNDYNLYQYLRALRSHGMLREMTDENYKQEIISQNPNLNKDFIFLAPSGNYRNTAIGATLLLDQILDLDLNGEKRAANFVHFLSRLDKNKYFTDFNMDGQNNYGFVVVLKDGTVKKRNAVEKYLSNNSIEYRRGCSGGGNQTLQPYLVPYKERGLVSFNEDEFPNSNYITQFSWYLGNNPRLKFEKIDKIVEILNSIPI